jgi:hypothetical protein
MQHLLKGFSAAAGARVVAAELFFELLIAVHDLDAALDAGFRREAFAPFTGRLESRSCRRTRGG